MNKEFYSLIHKNPIVAAINNLKDMDEALDSTCEIIFLLTGSILNLEELALKVRARNKQLFIHLDLMEGLARDSAALSYLHRNISPDGIITTKSTLIKKARAMNMFSIQRLFILDSLSLETALSSIRSTKPDAIEILPGIMPRVIKQISQEIKIPIIAGGLIEFKEDVIECIKAGAIGVSSSNKSIWKL